MPTQKNVRIYISTLCAMLTNYALEINSELDEKKCVHVEKGGDLKVDLICILVKKKGKS